MSEEALKIAENIIAIRPEQHYGRKTARGAILKCNVNECEFIRRATKYYVDDGIEGSKLRSKLANDFGLGFIFWIQLAIAVYQIIKLIKELRNK